MLKLVNVLIRLIGAVHITVVIFYDCFATTSPNPGSFHGEFGGNAKYLTIWANTALAFYFWLALITELILACKYEKEHLLKKIKDFMFLTCVYPMTAVVTSLFWGLYAIDRNLIFPKEVEKFLPSWLNHSLHTAIFIYAVLELLTSYHKPSSKKYHLLGVTIISGAYVAWFHVIYFMTGYWIYPILDHLSWFGRELLTAVGGLIVYGAFFLGLYANNIIWRNEVQEKKFDVCSASQISSC